MLTAMPTPTFKLLLNALRLGQPQDPHAAIRVLAEELAAQESELEELRRRLQVATSASNLLEAKAVRLERELDVLRARRQEHVDEAEHSGPLSRSVLTSPAHGQHAQPPHAQHAQPQHAQPQHAQAPPQHQPQHAQPQHAQPQRAQAQHAPPPPSDPGTDDGFQSETMVVSRQDLEALRRDEAPFQITPAGQRMPAPAQSIPGSPWTRAARGAEPRPTPQPAARPAAKPPASPTKATQGPSSVGPSSVRPGSAGPSSAGPSSLGPSSQPPSAGPISKTGPSVLAGVEPPSERRRGAQRVDEDGETFQDSGGGLPSLAAALGLSPNDPRILALRPSAREADLDDDPASEEPRRRS